MYTYYCADRLKFIFYEDETTLILETLKNLAKIFHRKRI